MIEFDVVDVLPWWFLDIKISNRKKYKQVYH